MSDAFAPRSLWQIMGAAFRLYGRHPVAVFAVGALVPLLTALLPPVLAGPPAAGAAPLESVARILQPSVLHALLLLAAATVFVFPLVGGALVHLVCQDALGGTVAVGRALGATWQRGLRLVGAVLLVTAAFTGMVAAAIGVPHVVWMSIGLRAWQPPVSGLLLLLAMLFALYLALRCLPYLQVALVEGRGPVAACVRGFRLTRGHGLRALGLVLCLSLLSGGAGALLGLVWDLGPTVAAVAVSPVITIALTLFYLDLRVRQEGYRATQLADELGSDSDAARSQS